MSFNEYKNAVAKKLLEYEYTSDEISKFLSTPRIDKVLRENYTDYTEKGRVGCAPSATADCLDMMYE